MTKCEREIYHATKIILKYNLVNRYQSVSQVMVFLFE